MTLHRIVCDDWSLAVLTSELGSLYQAFAAGCPSPLPDMPLQHRDFAVWQRDWLRDGIPEGELRHWRAHLAGAASLDLPTDRPRTQFQTFRGGRECLELSGALMESLKEMSRYTCQEDIAVGVMADNRHRDEVAGLIGPVANTLAMRSHVSPNERVRDFLKRQRELALSAYLHQNVPFEKLLEELELEADQRPALLPQVRFEVRSIPVPLQEWPGVHVSILDQEQAWSRFDLTLSIHETQKGLISGIEFNSDLFNRDRIERMLLHYNSVLGSISANQDQRIDEIELLTAKEKKQVLVEWNDSSRPHPDSSIVAVFEQQVERTPDKIAIVFEKFSISYRELNRRANRMALRLTTAGVGIETPVA
ncbi:MAG: condensation domain-containing protein, partial [Blastocatellia bacterium]